MKKYSNSSFCGADELFWENKQLEDLPNEIWVDAYGYDGIYSVSNLGRVRSEERRVPTFRGDRRVRARILSQAKSKDGRLSVNLSINSVAKPTPVNQLIYYSFNPDKLGEKERNEVFHKNKIDSDNRLVNLGHNKIKGASYKISIELGNVKHLDDARKKLHTYSKKTATIKNGKTTYRKCRKCGETKPQNEYEIYGRNICIECRKREKKEAYDRKLKEHGKTRKNNKVVTITDTVSGQVWVSSNKNKCIISRQQVNKYANTGKKVYPYRNSKYINPLLVEIKVREERNEKI